MTVGDTSRQRSSAVGDFGRNAAFRMRAQGTLRSVARGSVTIELRLEKVDRPCHESAPVGKFPAGEGDDRRVMEYADPVESLAALKFLEQYSRDRETGELRSLEQYLALFPAHPHVIRREHEAFRRRPTRPRTRERISGRPLPDLRRNRTRWAGRGLSCGGCPSRSSGRPEGSGSYGFSHPKRCGCACGGRLRRLKAGPSRDLLRLRRRRSGRRAVHRHAIRRRGVAGPNDRRVTGERRKRIPGRSPRHRRLAARRRGPFDIEDPEWSDHVARADADRALDRAGRACPSCGSRSGVGSSGRQARQHHGRPRRPACAAGLRPPRAPRKPMCRR